MRGCGAHTRAWLVRNLFSISMKISHVTPPVDAAPHVSPRPPPLHAPLAFTQNLLSEGWDVHTKLEDPTGSPLEDYHDEHEKEAEFSRRLKELDEDSSKRALVLMTSHVTGHKYAGNVIVRAPVGERCALVADRCCTDIHAAGCWCMVRSCIGTRGRVYRAYDYPWGTDTSTFTARGRQPRATRL
jgi:hypothetical protein